VKETKLYHYIRGFISDNCHVELSFVSGLLRTRYQAHLFTKMNKDRFRHIKTALK